MKLRSVKFEDVSHEMLVLMPQHVSSRVAEIFGAVAVSMGEAAKPILCEGINRLSCCFAWQVWHLVTIQHVSWRVKMVQRGRHNTFATFSEDALHFSRQAQHFGDLPCHFAWQAQHFRHVVLRFLRIALSALREVVTRCISGQVWRFVTCRENRRKPGTKHRF